MEVLDESHLTTGTASPFLPGTKIQYAGVKTKAEWLLEQAIVDGNCWLCHLAPNAKGYSSVGFGRAIKARAHRIVYFVCNPTHDQSMMVLHSCDNRRCINPKHLFLGTAQDNTNDMILKGRAKFIQPRCDHWHREAIMKLHKEGYSRFEIAHRLCLSPSTVWNYTSPRGAYYVVE